MDLKAYLKQKFDETQAETDKYLPRETQEMLEGAATMSGGLANVGKVASKAAPGIARKAADYLESFTNEQGVNKLADIPGFDKIRTFLRSQANTAPNAGAEAAQMAAQDVVAKREAAALRSNLAKPKMSDDQLALSRYNMDQQAENMMLKRMDDELMQANRARSAEEATIPGLDPLKKKK